MPEIGEIISDKYRVLERLGAGAMGIVFSAVHIETEKLVALKWLNPAIANVPTSAERFKREARATGRIHHPNVIAVHDCGEHAGQLYMVMELVAGCTLREHLSHAPEARLPLEEAFALLFPIMRGLAAAHAVGVLHRDLKPENVLLAASPDGLAPLPKVLDFGLAKVRSEAGFSAKLSMPGSVLGTYQYMAPEQLRANSVLDERIDVYALGAMLYEMLSGGPPYRADNPVDLVLEIHASEPAPLEVHWSGAPAGLSAALTRALARDPSARYPSVEAFAGALEPFTHQQRFRGGAPQPSVSSSPPPLSGSGQAQGAPRRASSQSSTSQATDCAALLRRARARIIGPRAWLHWSAAAALFLHPGAAHHATTAAAASPAPTVAAAQPTAAPVLEPQPNPESDWAPVIGSVVSEQPSLVMEPPSQLPSSSVGPPHIPSPSAIRVQPRPTPNASRTEPLKAQPTRRATASDASEMTSDQF